MPISRVLLRSIALVYLLLFIGGLLSSGYLLAGTIMLKPILLIRLLQYILLCVMFSILVLNAAKALTLKQVHIVRLATSTKNFKWLFSISTLLCIAAWAGAFDNSTKAIKITLLQISILILLALFCFWSDSLLKHQETDAEENIGA